VAKASDILGCTQKSVANRGMEVIPPLFSEVVRHILVLCPVLVSQNKRDRNILQ